MASFDFDENTKKGVIWFRKGGITSRSAAVNGNTQKFDIAGQLISVEIPNPLATVNLAGIPISVEEHDHIRDHLLPIFGKFKSGG